MIGLWKNEWMKAWYGRKMAIFLIVMAGCIALGVGISFLVKNNTDVNVTAGKFAGYGNGLLATIVILYAVILITNAITSEFTTGTVKQLCIRPASRLRILFSKWTGNFIFSLALLTCISLCTILIGLALFPLDDGTVADILSAQGEIFLLLLPTIFIYTSIATLLSVLTRNTAVTLVCTLFPFFFSMMISFLTTKYDWMKWVFLTHIDVLNNYHSTGVGVPPFSNMWASIGFLTLHALIFLLIAHIVFKQRDMV